MSLADKTNRRLDRLSYVCLAVFIGCVWYILIIDSFVQISDSSGLPQCGPSGASDGKACILNENAKPIPKIIPCKINEFNDTWKNQDNSTGWACLTKTWFYRSYEALNWKSEIVHTTTAQVIEFKDSEKRELITLGNTKFNLDNFSKNMKIGDIVKIYEINHYAETCVPTAIELYNNTIIKGYNIKPDNFTNWDNDDYRQDEINPSHVCDNYTTFTEVQ